MIKDEKINYGVRLANHNGNDSKGLEGGDSYSIKVSETSPFVRYNHDLSTTGDTVIEANLIGGLNLATVEAGHTILETSCASATTLMLEGGIFAGLKSDDITFGGGLYLPLDGYKGAFSWTYYGYPLNYDVTITKNITLFLILLIILLP